MITCTTRCVIILQLNMDEYGWIYISKIINIITNEKPHRIGEVKIYALLMQGFYFFIAYLLKKRIK